MPKIKLSDCIIGQSSCEYKCNVCNYEDRQITYLYAESFWASHIAAFRCKYCKADGEDLLFPGGDFNIGTYFIRFILEEL